MERRNREYDVAVSYASEDLAYVRDVVERLEAAEIRVFFDKNEEATLWGKNLNAYFTDLYRNRTNFVLMFVSEAYGKKRWTAVEREAAQSRAQEEDTEYILPVRFDDTELSGLLPTVGYIDVQGYQPADVARLLLQKLGRNPFQIKATAVPSPKSTALEGEVTFRYSSHNGRYRIGEGTFEFETMWGKASNTSIHCYSDPAGIREIALAAKNAAPEDLSHIADLDYTSRHRTPETGRYVALQNTNGIFALIRILEIKDDTRGDDVDELRFRYWIRPDGGDDFSEVVRDA